MERLNLSAEYCQAELATSSPEALASMAELRDHIRNLSEQRMPFSQSSVLVIPNISLRILTMSLMQ